MAKKQERPDRAEAREEDVRAAGQELARSLWRLGLAITATPLRLLPEETRHHLRAAGREAVRAGVALNRGVLEASESALADAKARLDEFEEWVMENE